MSEMPRILGCGSDRMKPSFILHNTPLNQGLCAIHNVTIFASFSDVAYPFLFKSFEKAPETIGEHSEGRCCRLGLFSVGGLQSFLFKFVSDFRAY